MTNDAIQQQQLQLQIEQVATAMNEMSATVQEVATAEAQRQSVLVTQFQKHG